MERRQFFPNLELARGVAALMVALFHVGQLTYLADGVTKTLIPKIQDTFTWPAQISRILGNGPGAVIFFFALSGFVLTMVLEKSQGSKVEIATRFATGRIFRIFPGVWCTLGVFYLFLVLFGRSLDLPSEYEPIRFLLNALLIIKSIDPVMWSLQVELAAVPLLLSVYFGWRRYGFPAIFWPYMVLFALSFFGQWNHLLGNPGQLGQIFSFLAGMTVYLYGRSYVDMLKHPWIWLVIATAAFLVTRHIVGWSSYFSFWLEATFASAVIALLAFGIGSKQSALWYRTLQFIGRVSFSFYLLHPLTLMFSKDTNPLFTAAVQAGTPPLLLASAAFFISTAAVLPLAWLQYRLVEVPMIAVGKSMFTRRRKPTEAMA
jgi:peptidoglycan/LPS O-acetylase OafA/YrhL